ncbi:hypothetical protein TVAG_384160 [Trichomonas vaginalis G3]|uniref:Uncharacterized protein n=1 Tax=Trichomonas vaginalis (strain ATCC PRA-98 / G3) TaxID=412133 RepID=A2F0B5_TRIV3|nr:hypothetical protein TVAGG3_0480880 [Trichomonas vaginalis G3]EAY01677.1 hypothetical protein TVAG_384160 [Trichomonas vaginalis G3]KAI5515693.1 hypothetical protein TVAGG3_0480880 [Trichomonas vaginalis G3]|eukprot:XP_001314270.1 hypothetical protein [Trichomonas vaginalis G3]
MHSISKLPKYRPRHYTFDIVDGNVIGYIHCIGKDGKELHLEHFDSFIGHKRQTAIPQGVDFAQAEENIKKYIWTGSSRKLFLNDKTCLDIKGEIPHLELIADASLNKYSSFQIEYFPSLKIDTTSLSIVQHAPEHPSGVSNAIFDQI